jgi:hypothetical protein
MAGWAHPATALRKPRGNPAVSRKPARVGRMGAAFLASLRAHRVIAVDDKAVTMVTRTSARLRIYRGDGDRGAVLAWDLVRSN